MMNSMEFVRICESDSFAKFELKDIFRCINEMHRAKTFDDVTFYYDLADYHRYGLWTYFCGKADTPCMAYCSHLIGVLSKIYMRQVDRLYKERIKGRKNEKK